MRLNQFVWLSGVQWPIEQCFEEGKSELGMDHYEVRKYLDFSLAPKDQIGKKKHQLLLLPSLESYFK